MNNFDITAIEAMHQNAIQMFLRSKHDPSISQEQYFGEALAFNAVLKLIAPEVLKVSLNESLALIEPVKVKTTATYNNDMTEGYVPLQEQV